MVRDTGGYLLSLRGGREARVDVGIDEACSFDVFGREAMTLMSELVSVRMDLRNCAERSAVDALRTYVKLWNKALHDILLYQRAMLCPLVVLLILTSRRRLFVCGPKYVHVHLSSLHCGVCVT